MKIKSILSTLLLTALVGCGGPDSVNVNTHGDKIDDHERRIALLEALGKLHDEVLESHGIKIKALEAFSKSSDKKADDNKKELQLQIDALQVLIDLNTGLDNSRYVELTTLISQLRSDMLAAIATGDATSVATAQAALDAALIVLRGELEGVRSTLDGRITDLKDDFDGHVYDNNEELDALWSIIFGDEECDFEGSHEHHEEEGPNLYCSGIMSTLEYLIYITEENADDIEDLEEDIEEDIEDLEEDIEVLESDVRLIFFVGEILFWQVQDLAGRISTLEGTVSSLQGQINNLNAEDTRLEGLINQLRIDMLAAIATGDAASVSTAQAALDAAIATLRGELATGDAASVVTAQAALDLAISGLLNEIDSLINRLNIVEGNYVTNTDITNAITNALITINQQIVALIGASDVSSSSIINLQNQIDTLTTNLNAIVLTPGDDGVGCTIAETTGGANITCGDTTVFISDGADGDGDEDRGDELTASSACREIDDSGLYYKQSTGWDSVHFYLGDSSCSGNGDKDNLLGGPSGTQSIVDYHGMTFVIVSEAKGSNVFTVTFDNDQ